jgi:hypothetical protein
MNFADQEELAIRKKTRGKKRRNDIIWNSLTALVIIASVAVVGYFVLLFSNPASTLNPYPPPTLPAPIQIPTATLTPMVPTPTLTLEPTATFMPTDAPVSSDSTAIPTDASASTATTAPYSSEYLFAIKGNPVGMTNTTFHPSLDCNWQGVAGKVTDIQGKGVQNLAVHLTGTYGGKQIDQTTLSGGAAKWIGDGGYELVLEVGSAPIGSTGQLTIQLQDSSYVPLSATVTFDTYAECGKNLILINFQQAR